MVVSRLPIRLIIRRRIRQRKVRVWNDEIYDYKGQGNPEHASLEIAYIEASRGAICLLSKDVELE